jgi:hypothetical protein
MYLLSFIKEMIRKGDAELYNQLYYVTKKQNHLHFHYTCLIFNLSKTLKNTL